MERIRELNRYQRILIILLILMTVVSIPLYAITASRAGYLYCNEIFVPRQENGATLYETEIDHRPCVFTVTADTVTLTAGDKTYGPYILREDPTAVPEDHALAPDMTGIVILDGEETFFRGGVSNETKDFWLVSAEGGHPIIDNITTTYTADGTEYNMDGTPIDPMEPTPYQIISLLRGPELTHKGDWQLWFMSLIIAIITAVSILFADELFYLSICFQVQNAETAEPTDWHIATRNFGWGLLTFFTAVSYFMGLL